MKRHGRKYWEKVVSEFEQNEQTQREFCQQRDLKLSTLQYWIYRLRKERVTRTTADLGQRTRNLVINDELKSKLGQIVFDLSPNAVVLLDRDYRIVLANEQCRTMFGEWEGRYCYEVFKRLHRPCNNCVAALSFADGEVHSAEEHGFDRDGKRTFIELKSIPIVGPTGEVDYVVEFFNDISRAKSLESRFKLLFERVPCYITVIERDYRIVDANWRHQETFGNTIGRYCYEIYKQSEKPCQSCPVARTFRDGRVHYQQQEAMDKTGKTIHFIVHSAPIHDPSGNIVQAIEMATDITRLIELQQQLDRAEPD